MLCGKGYLNGAGEPGVEGEMGEVVERAACGGGGGGSGGGAGEYRPGFITSGADSAGVIY